MILAAFIPGEFLIRVKTEEPMLIDGKGLSYKKCKKGKSEAWQMACLV